MANAQSHDFSSSARLETLSATARTRATILRRLADDLECHDGADVHGDARLAAIADVLLNGTDAELTRCDLDYVLRLDVPRALVAGDTREGR